MIKKVFLVDDEIVIRENVRDCVQWHTEGLNLCGDAPDGEVALPLIESLQPHILITDIKMPFMNGLELSAIVRKRWPDIKIIILSGHDEFEFARQALRLGIGEYCLKPVSAADLIEMLRRVSEVIDKEIMDKKRIEELQSSLSVKADTSREKLISDLCNGFLASAEAIEKASLLDMTLHSKHYAVAIADIRQGDDGDLVHKIETEMEQVMMMRINTFTYKRSKSEKVWFFRSNEQSQLASSLRYFMEDLRTELEGKYVCTISVGVGGTKQRLQAVHESFIEAEEDKHWRKLAKQNKTALLDGDVELIVPSSGLDRSTFLDFLKVGAPNQADSFIHAFAGDFRAVDWKSSLYGYYLLLDLTLEAIRIVRQQYRSAAAAEEALPFLRERIRSISSHEEACAYLKLLSETFWQWRSDAADKYGDLIARVKTYVSLHFANDRLSLQEAADHVNVSTSHLSKVFSQETGQTFIEFLMQTRIRKAMELLQSTNAKSYEVAYQVGYNDPHYFSNLFKRVTGTTIRDFRKHGLPPASPFLWEANLRA